MHALTHYIYDLCIPTTSTVALLSNSHGFAISCVPLLSLFSVGTRRLNSEVGSPSASLPLLISRPFSLDSRGHCWALSLRASKSILRECDLEQIWFCCQSCCPPTGSLQRLFSGRVVRCMRTMDQLTIQRGGGLNGHWCCVQTSMARQVRLVYKRQVLFQ